MRVLVEHLENGKLPLRREEEYRNRTTGAAGAGAS
jgi:hypothetical protein